MIRRTSLPKEFGHTIEEMGQISKEWAHLKTNLRGFVITYQLRTRYGNQTITQTVSLRRAQNFCRRHGLPLPENAGVHV